MIQSKDIKEFARKVESLCDFFLDQLEKDGSMDVIFLQSIKEEAVDLQFKTTENIDQLSIVGLNDFVHSGG